jgi:DNA primase catalytic core
MSELSELLNTKIYPAIYERAEKLFPEFQFRRIAKGYVSTTNVKITGETGEPKKVYYYENNPKYLIDKTRGSISIYDYIQGDSLTDKEVLRKLEELSGVSLPKGNYDTVADKKQRREAQLWEDAQQYFAVILMEAEDPKAQALQEYLKERGYTPKDIQGMELGCITSQEALRKYLKGKGYSKEEIASIDLIKPIGESHTWTIPLREPGGNIRGISVRNIHYKKGDKFGKYLNSTGLSKTDLLINLKTVKGKKHLVIVESQIDALLCSARGIENVVALGSKDLTKAQLETAVKYEAKKITLCLDREEQTIPNTLQAIKLIQREQPELKIFVAQLPEGVKDPDELIKEKGAEAFKKVIAKPINYYEYLLEQIFKKYDELQDELQDEETRSLSAENKEDLLEEVKITATNIEDPIDREQFLQIFLDNEGIKKLGITQESYSAVVEKLRYKKEEEEQKKALQTLFSEAKDLQREGKTTEEVIEKTEQGLQDVKAISGKGLLPPVLTYEDVIKNIISLPPALKTGYKTLDKFVGFPTGAITLIAGRTSHGKTSFMFNLLLRMSELYKNEGYKFYFFTYEEPVTNITVKLINRLADTNLRKHFIEDPHIHSNYEFIKAYIKQGREDIPEIETAKDSMRMLIDEGRISLIDKSYSVEDLSTLIAYLSKREQIGAVFIDYIQRMTTQKKSQDIRSQIVHISNEVLQIAKKNNLPIILGAQLNRETLKGKGKPTLENLKEAGNLEEDANTVISVYNESREKAETDKGESYQDMREVDLEIKTLKNREGEVNKTAKLNFDKWTGAIKEYGEQ